MMKPAKQAIDVALLSGDIEASLSFYRDLLGLSLSEERPVSNGTMYRLRFGDTDLKLIDPSPSLSPSPGPAGVNSQLGYRAVAFCITNLSAVCAELKRRGVPFVVEEKEARPGVRIAMVSDPDGNVVEFVERS